MPAENTQVSETKKRSRHQRQHQSLPKRILNQKQKKSLRLSLKAPNNLSLLNMPNRFRLPILISAAVLLFTRTLPARDYGDALVSGSIGDARNLIPILASDSASAEICGMIFNGLVKYDKDINLTGDLAESWEIKDDGLTIIFHLRKGIRWQDGTPFSAQDVKFTYQKLIDPLVRTPYSGDFKEVRSLEVIDEHTIKVTYKEPFSPPA